MVDGEEDKDNNKLFFLGKHPVKNFNKNFDLFYDQYKEMAHKKGFKGELKFVTSYDMVWVYVKIKEQ